MRMRHVPHKVYCSCFPNDHFILQVKKIENSHIQEAKDTMKKHEIII